MGHRPLRPGEEREKGGKNGGEKFTNHEKSGTLHLYGKMGLRPVLPGSGTVIPRYKKILMANIIHFTMARWGKGCKIEQNRCDQGVRILRVPLKSGRK